MSLQKVNNIIFDFDGTLADTLPLVGQYAIKNQHRFSKKQLGPDDFHGLSIKEVFDYLNLPWYRILQVVWEFKRFVRAHLDQIHLFPGIIPFIQDLQNSGLKLYIISSNSNENITGILERFQLVGSFRRIASDSSLFGKHITLKKFLKEQNLEKERSLYIGDEVRDIEACAKVNLPMIAVSWGWDKLARLQKTGHPRIVSSVTELRECLISSD